MYCSERDCAASLRARLFIYIALYVIITRTTVTLVISFSVVRVGYLGGFVEFYNK